ncbi:MAG: SpoIID/LytB domain-containing protein [Deltaproteobacteria bacterium]|nr:SpoIID/LytB domain-containing protein [Deltaproteobacteria bacterium]
MWKTFAFAGVLSALCASAAAELPPGRFAKARPLALEELYGSRVRFKKRQPVVLVGLMDLQEQVVVAGDGPIRLVFHDGDMPRTIYADSGSRFRFRPIGAKPAELQYDVVVKSEASSGPDTLTAEIATWSARGRNARVTEGGALLGLSGTVLDTRRRRLSVGPFATKAAADEFVASVSQEGLSELFVEESIARPPEGGIAIHDGADRLIHKAIGSVFVSPLEGERARVFDVEYARGYRWHGRETREFWGDVYVAIDRAGKLAAVNSVPAEKLLLGLVPKELFADAPIEALKAQAVTARGEIFGKLAHRHFAEPFHLCSEQHCQVYAGAGGEAPRPSEAVEATKGRVAVRPRTSKDGPLELVESYYSSSCGGFSETNDVVWGTKPSPSLGARLDEIGTDPALERFRAHLDEPTLRVFLDSFPPVACARSKFLNAKKFRWKEIFEGEGLSQVAAKVGLSELTDVSILGRGPGNRVTGLRLKGKDKSVDVLRELPVRQLFNQLNSGLFVLDVEKDASGRVTRLTFTGGGWGHGVGMCQQGAIARAQAGHDYQRILSHYYGGAVVERIY